MMETIKEFTAEYQKMRIWSIPERVKQLERLYQQKDYIGFLSENLGNMNGVLINGRPFKEAALEVLQKCPASERQKRPIALLQIAYHLYGLEDNETAEQLMAEIRGYLEKMQDSQLLGEWQLVSMFRYFPDIQKMLPILQKAAKMMTKPSKVILETEPFFFGLPGILGIIWREPGTLLQVEADFESFLALYRKLTQNGGMGADTFLKAEIAFQQGKIDQAEQYCYKALYQTQTAGQDCLWLGALHVVGQIHVHLREREKFVRIFQQMNLAAHLHSENAPIASKVFDYCSGALMLELKYSENVAEWIILRDYLGLPTVFSRAAVGQLYIRWAFAEQEMNKGIGIAEGWLADEQKSFLTVNIIKLYTAIALWRKEQETAAQELVKEAVQSLEKDQLLLPIAGFYYACPKMVDPVLNQMSNGTYQYVHRLLEEYDHNWQKTFYYLLTNAHKEHFSARERELTELVVKRMSNKEIAEALGITERTVKFHLTQIYKKLGLKNRKQLIEIIENHE